MGTSRFAGRCGVRRCLARYDYAACRHTYVARLSSVLDGVKPLTEVETRHDWYVGGSRYSLLTLVIRATYDGPARVAGRSAAYLMTAEDNAAVYEKASENIEPDVEGGRLPGGVLADYDVSFAEGRLAVEYELTDDADVSLSVSDVSALYINMWKAAANRLAGTLPTSCVLICAAANMFCR